MNSFAMKTVTLLLSIFLLSYIGVQIFRESYEPFDSEIVEKGNYLHEVDLNGYFVRTEKVLDQKSQGVIQYCYKNAEKFSKDAVVANIYEKNTDLINLNKIERLQHKRAILVASQSTEQIADTNNLNSLNSQINEVQAKIAQQIDDNQLEKLDESYSELMLVLNKTAVLINKTKDFNATIASVDDEIKTLQSQISSNIKKVKAEESAYFSNAVDGYEKIFTTDSLKDISIEKIQSNLKNTKVKKTDDIGKSISSFGWKFVCLIDADETQHFKKGQKTKLKFSVSLIKEVDIVVEDIIIEEGQKKAGIIFSGEYIDSDFITMRFEKPKAIVANYDGILIPKKAIRFETKLVEEENKETKVKTKVEKQVKGVYTLLGKTVRFKEVDVLYEDKFMLVSKIKDDSDFVNVYDKVITRGKYLDGTKK